MTKKFPTWIEIQTNRLNQDDLLDLVYSNELIMDSAEYYIIFFGGCTKLHKQEYNFLLHVLRKNGEKIRIKKLMHEIKSKAKPEKYTDTSYKIKNHIKEKLKKVCPKTSPPLNEIDWIIMDRSYESEIENKQNLDFNRCFKMLIRIVDGQYLTDFVHKRIN